MVFVPDIKSVPEVQAVLAECQIPAQTQAHLCHVVQLSIVSSIVSVYLAAKDEQLAAKDALRQAEKQAKDEQLAAKDELRQVEGKGNDVLNAIKLTLQETQGQLNLALIRHLEVAATLGHRALAERLRELVDAKLAVKANSTPPSQSAKPIKPKVRCW